MRLAYKNRESLARFTLAAIAVVVAAGLIAMAPSAHAQASSQGQQAQDIPDAPSSVQPPVPTPLPRDDKPLPPPPPASGHSTNTDPFGAGTQPPPPMPPVETIAPGSVPRQQSSTPAKDQLYKLIVTTNFVEVPVMVKDADGRRVDGLLSKDFSVFENGKKQDMKFFTSDPFELSVAVIIDLGMPDVAVQKVNQTFPALIGAFSPYDEVAIYTYSSTVSQVSDYTGSSQKLTTLLNQMKTVRGHNNGVPVTSGPMASGPTVNGVPVGGPPIQPVGAPPKESHVLNDAILEAALDLSKRDRTRRKVIFVISDGREMGSKASYSDVLKLLQTHGIQVKGVAIDSAALPIYKQVEKLRLPFQGYSNILPKYASATGGGTIYTELSRNAIEETYAQITSEARNQYTLGYTTRATASTAYRNIEVRVDRLGLNIYAKDGYYPIAPAR